MTTYLTDREIHVLGIQRTGQHAVTSWLIGHFDKVCYVNAMTSGQVPSRKRRGLTQPYWYFEPQKRPEWDVSTDNKIREGQDAIIMGTEWYKPELSMHPLLDAYRGERAKDSGVDKFSLKQNYVMVIRSPYNHYASILKWHKCKQLKNPQRFLRCWKNFANEFLGNTDDISIPKIFIKYDEWFVNEEYRKSISRSLGLVYSDERLNTVMKIGASNKFGSSFDSMSLKDKAQDMKVHERWKEYKDNDIFKSVMRDEELRELSKQIFGGFPL